MNCATGTLWVQRRTCWAGMRWRSARERADERALAVVALTAECKFAVSIWCLSECLSGSNLHSALLLVVLREQGQGRVRGLHGLQGRQAGELTSTISSSPSSSRMNSTFTRREGRERLARAMHTLAMAHHAFKQLAARATGWAENNHLSSERHGERSAKDRDREGFLRARCHVV